MKKTLIACLMLLSNTVFAGGTVSGQFQVSLTILPSVNSNTCSNEVCSFNSETLGKSLTKKESVVGNNYLATKKDNVITVSF